MTQIIQPRAESREPRALGVIAFALLVSVSACGGEKTSTTDSAAGSAQPLMLAPQDIATAVARPVSTVVLVSGSLDPADIVQVRAQVPGTVQGVRVDRGTRVSKGDVLAVIEAAGVRGQAAAARAQVAVAQQRFEASKRLFEAGAISAIDYKSAEAGYEAARAMEAAASESADRASITSPINGVVSARAVSGGEAVNPGQPLFTVVDASELELAGRIGLQDAASVSAGQPVTFTLDAFPERRFMGRVARVDPVADINTRQVGVYVRMRNPNGNIVGGQYARGRIETGAARNEVVIPVTALLSRSGDSATVYVIGGSNLARRRVVLGVQDESSGMIAVRSGIRSGDRVLLNPSLELGEGGPVSFTSDSARATRVSAR